MNNNNAVTLTRKEVWFSDKKEQVYFTVTFTLPRVGEVTAKYHADRYVARIWNNDNNTSREGWTEWRYTLDGDIPGVGPKTRTKVYETVEPVLKDWIENSDEYCAKFQNAVAFHVRREIQDQRSGNNGKYAFETYRAQLSFKAQTHIAQALDHIDAARALLDDLG